MSTLGQYRATPETLLDGEQRYPRLDSSGALVTSGGGGGPVTIADGADVAEGATSATAYSDATGAAAGTLAGLNKGLYVLTAAMSAKLPASLGIKTAAASLSIAPASDSTFVVTQATASNLNAQVVGAVASGTTDSGNPIKTGGVALSSAPAAVTTGQRVNTWLSLYGATVMAAASRTGMADAFNNSTIGFISMPDANVGPLGVAGMIYNGGAAGVSWDRIRSITGALADGTGLGVTAVEQAGALFNNITTATTTTVKSGKGIFHKLAINTPVASATITIYDSLTATGTKIATITLGSVITGMEPSVMELDLQFSTGLTIVTSGATDITVIYR